MSIFRWFRRKPTYRFRIAQTTRVRHSWLWEVVDCLTATCKSPAAGPVPSRPSDEAYRSGAPLLLGALGAEVPGVRRVVKRSHA